MNKYILTALCAGLCLSVFAEGTTEAPSGYTLRWQDEFNGSALNEAVWNIEVPEVLSIPSNHVVAYSHL